MSLSAWPALVSGGARMKLKIDMDKPSNLAGDCRGHLLKWSSKHSVVAQTGSQQLLVFSTFDIFPIPCENRVRTR